MKIKNYILLLLIISGNILFAQTKGPQTCFSDCVDINNNIFVENGYGSTLATNIVAQAYYWEICNRSTVVEIVGSNTNQNLELNILRPFNSFKIKLTVFIDGKCEKYCHTFSTFDHGIFADNLKNSINISPNPITNNVIKFQNKSNKNIDKVEIYNHVGNLLNTKRPITNEIKLNSNYKKGIYILKFYINEKIYIKKIIKN